MSKVYPTINEIKIAVTNPSNSFKDSNLKQGQPVKKGVRVIQYTGGFSTVFPFKVKNEKKALRIWTSKMEESEIRSSLINDYLGKLSSDYFVKFKYHKGAILINGDYYPLIIMDWVDGYSLKQYIEGNLNNSLALNQLAENFVKLVSFLHSKGISHGDLQHGNIMITNNNNLVLVDYDSLFVPGMENYTDNIKGLPGYQHPMRGSLKKLSPKSDYFSELVIYLSLLVYANDKSFWVEGTEHLLFSPEDLQKPKNSSIFKKLSQSNDDKIIELSNKLLEFLKIKDIEKLSPLEDLLVDKKKVILEGFEDAFGSIPNNKNPKNTPPPKTIKPNIDDIDFGFKKPTKVSPPKTTKPNIDDFDFDFNLPKKKIIGKGKKPNTNDFDF